jgi:serine/threonine protein phosphatase 1
MVSVAGRTFAIGDIHGEPLHLQTLLARLPRVAPRDTIVFLGDYLDRGPGSAEVVRIIRDLADSGPCQVVALRGNHEDAWLRVIDGGWLEFILPAGNGCLQALRSFTGSDADHAMPSADEMATMLRGDFFPADVVEWMRALPHWYEDDRAIYVHAGVPRRDGRWLHPAEADKPAALLWTRAEAMFREYRGKTLVVGHTATELLPPELSDHTPADPTDMWAGPSVIALDTGCGSGGFLTAVELPSRTVYESR